MQIEQTEFGWVSSDPTGAHDYLLPHVLKHVRTLYGGQRISLLDLGCGNGYVASKLAAEGHQVTAVDAAVDGLNIARSIYPNIRFLQLSVYEDVWDGFEGGMFDVVVSLEVIEHLLYPRMLFEKSYWLIKPGGYLILSTPYHGYFKNLALSVLNGWDKHFHVATDGGHIKFFSKKTLEQMASETGFRNIRISGAGRVTRLWKSMIMVAQK